MTTDKEEKEEALRKAMVELDAIDYSEGLDLVWDNSLVRKVRYSSPWRDRIMFFGGALGLLNEAILQSAQRPSLIVLFSMTMGLPALLRDTDPREKTGTYGSGPR